MGEEDPLLNEKAEHKSTMQVLRESLSNMRLIPADMWFLLTVLFVVHLASMSFMLVLPLFLSDDYNYNDSEAGMVFGGVGAMFTAYALTCGTVVDKIGIKLAICLASLIGAAALGLISFVTAEAVVLILLLFFLPLPAALGVPAAKIAPRRYATE
jgi:predicted MFS family arabinose efflux permease